MDHRNRSIFERQTPMVHLKCFFFKWKKGQSLAENNIFEIRNAAKLRISSIFYQIQNHFSTPINVFRNRNGTLVEVGQVKPGSIFNVPLHALYAADKELFFSLANYKTSVQGINWKESPNDFKFTKYLQCDPVHTFEPFYLTVSSSRPIIRKMK